MSELYDADGWIIDLTDWKRKDKRAFLRDANKADETGDESLLDPHMMRIIKKWPFEADPGDPATYDELDLFQTAEVSYRVSEALKSLTAQIQQGRVSN